MKTLISLVIGLITSLTVSGQSVTASGPDGNLKVNVSVKQGIPVYSVTYKNKTILEDSPLGFVANVGDCFIFSPHSGT